MKLNHNTNTLFTIKKRNLNLIYSNKPLHERNDFFLFNTQGFFVSFRIFS